MSKSKFIRSGDVPEESRVINFDSSLEQLLTRKLGIIERSIRLTRLADSDELIEVFHVEGKRLETDKPFVIGTLEVKTAFMMRKEQERNEFR